MRRILPALALLLLASRFPPDSNVVDPRDYGAIPNDGLPDTAAFRAAIADAVSVGYVYEIAGDADPATIEQYIIDGPLKAQILHQGVMKWTNNWIVMCDPDVEIYVPPNTPAFANAAAQQGVIQYGSTTLSKPTAPPASGGGSEGYRNTFDGGCTIRIGSGNPGARGIDWVVNNRGAIRGVRIEAPPGQGTAGIWMGRPWPGPGLIEGVTVRGFQRCTWDGYVQYGLVYRDVTCEGQTVFGLDATGSASTIERLHSINTVPAVRVESPAGHVVIIDSVLEGGSPTRGAIQLGVDSKATVRDVRASGYQALIRQGPVMRTDLGLEQSEWLSHPGHSLFGDPVASLRLPAVDPPRVYDTRNWELWAQVRVNTRDALDDLPAIEAALAAGRPIVQLVRSAPDGSGLLDQVYVSAPIRVPCHVRRLEGMEARVIAMASFPAGEPLFVFDDACDWSDVTVLEHVWPGKRPGDPGPMLAHRDARTLYVKDSYMASNSSGIVAEGGSMFLSNVVTSGLVIAPGTSVWAWQLNPENFNETQGIVNSGVLRVVGMKTEGLGRGGKPTLTTRSGGRTEILGGMMMPCVGMGALDVELGFVVEDGAQVALAYTNWCGKDYDRSTWDAQVRETRGGETRELPPEALPAYSVEGGNRVTMTLYRAGAPICEGTPLGFSWR